MKNKNGVDRSRRATASGTKKYDLGLMQQENPNQQKPSCLIMQASGTKDFDKDLMNKEAKSDK